MPLDTLNGQSGRRRAAIIGAGISGLGAAYALSKTHAVTIFEAEPRLGGHARTLEAGRKRTVPIDTGFIVFNYRNYPLLTGLFTELETPVKKSDMAFAASIDGGRIEYGLHSTPAIFAQKSNLVRPGFWRMLADIPRFNRGVKALANQPGLTLGDALDRLNMGQWHRQYFLLPLSGAVWSASPEQMLDFPLATFIQFFKNHGLLTINDQPQWHTVDGGSRVYVAQLAAAILANGGEIRTSAPIENVRRNDGSVTVKSAGQDAESFDDVVFACHSDQALALLGDPDQDEQRILGAMRYSPNTVILHDDPSVMPKRRVCWASWNYQGKANMADPAMTVTYWMNRLQGIPEDVPLFVTLNPSTPIQDKYVFDETVLNHPVFDQPAIDAQAALPGIQGKRNTWFCGAYTRYGFHEDGLLSAVTVARAMGASPAWA
ncbi:MAG: NAD(P)/FAD-dependent oxidoreductase [Alphaproteobacteria bacterium]